MKKCITILFFILISIGTFAQIPDWAINLPKPDNSTMNYLVGRGEGNTFNKAYNEAVCNALSQLIRLFGLSVNSNDVMNAVYSGQELATISRDYNIPPFKEVCMAEIKQQGLERVYVLFQIPANAMITNPIFEPFTKCDDNSKNGNKYVAWNITGAGYPWNLVSGIEFRYGKKIGIGAYLDLGVDFTHVKISQCEKIQQDPSSNSYYPVNVYQNESTTRIAFHYSGGLKFYFYKGLFVDLGYGTISRPVDQVYCIHNSNNPWSYVYLPNDLDMNNSETSTMFDKSVARSLVQKNGHGLLFHAGYNLVTNLEGGTGFFLGVSAGASYDVIYKTIAPSFMLKLGVAWGVK